MTTSVSASGLRAALGRAPTGVLVVYAAGVAFAAYFCMYAFRRPFAAASFEGLTLAGLELKTAFVLSQLLGYTASKYLGIKVCSETTRARRLATLALLVVAAEAALVLFAVLPQPLKPVALFLNGVPLGMVWGLVVWYLEGRRVSELLVVGLSASYIVASAAVKDVGRWFMADWGVSPWWMPAVTGAAFLPLYGLAIWGLDQIPEPTAADVAARSERVPMGARSRWDFLYRYAGLLAPLLVVYFFLTAYRDYRDVYGVAILEELGYGGDPLAFTKADTVVTVGVLAALALLYWVRDARRGLVVTYALMTAGVALLGVVTPLYERGALDGFWWMTLVGLGLYLAYVPFGAVLFERLMAATRAPGTAVFAIYVADALGYTGSAAVQLWKDLVHREATRLSFFVSFTYLLAAGGAILLVWSALAAWRATRLPATARGVPGADAIA